jgi:hypothetical protein
MTTGHISFQKMSDLYDSDFHEQEDRDALLKHIMSCGECGCEYTRLGKTLELMKRFSRHSFPPDFLRHKTMKKIKFNRKKRLILKSAPAIAASVLIVAGVSLFYSGIFTGGTISVQAGKSLNASLNDTEQVIDIFRKHNATISDITDSYIEGTVPIATFNNLCKDLGYRKVAYLIGGGSGEPARDWGNALEEVSAGDVRAWEPQDHEKGGSKRLINFRVFR